MRLRAYASGWPPSDHVPPLARSEVHVWLSELDRDDRGFAYLEGLLSADERERARSFAFDRHRRRFVLLEASCGFSPEPQRARIRTRSFGRSAW